MATQQENQDVQDNEEIYTDVAQEEQGYIAEEETEDKNSRTETRGGDRSNFIHGLAVGLGVGCIATFVILWISLFFMPRLPSGITYENLLSVFIYPLIYLLAVGLIALTAGVVREYYSIKNKI